MLTYSLGINVAFARLIPATTRNTSDSHCGSTNPLISLCSSASGRMSLIGFRGKMRVRIGFEKPNRLFTRWDEKAGLPRDAIRSQLFDVLKAQRKGDRQCRRLALCR